MSIGSHTSDAHHGDHGGHHPSGESHSTMSGYLTGFGLSVVLTVIPFWLVWARPIEDGVVTSLLVILLAVAQIIVHMIYFLHMDAKSEGGWTIMALIFTVVLVVITISGSLWVMYHLNSNMMPMDNSMQMDGLEMKGMSMDGASDAGKNAPEAGASTESGHGDHGGMTMGGSQNGSGSGQ
ncbi:cytochrome o ubiquinol oxidase subunit IV [Jiella endophytica]|uniref:Cytochrome bo(3) ubiquinol oxidase subunit 4 n=1 Tax=Jiella endophytica TaxID=2558362 RepID=A0A4Y8RTZ5_9HYPH|nr:cytochrome o ubiquinol oxidase subunit IV [Jiella endophytica]